MGKYQYTYSGSSPYRKSRHNPLPKWIFVLIAICIVASAIFILLWIGEDIESDTAPNIEEVQKIIPDGEISLPDNDTISPPPTQQNNASLLNVCKEAELAFAQDEFPEAVRLAEQVLSKVSEENTLWDRAATVLTKANTKIFFTDVPTPRKEIYTVVSGDSLSKIAYKFNTTIEAIQEGNELSKASSLIHIGQSFSIYHGKWKIKVSKSKYKLYLYDDDQLFKVYKVGIGIQNRTPVGSFIISVKQKNPDWHDRKTGITYKYGTVNNVLGTRWMTLLPIAGTGTDTGLTGYGIHGTKDPTSVGKKSSKGCMRMINDDVNELFKIIPLKTQVTIIE